MADSNIRVTMELVDKAAAKALDDFTKKADSADKGLKKLGDTGQSTFSEISVNIGKSLGVWDIFQGNIAANVVTAAFEKMVAVAHEFYQVLIVEAVQAAQKQQNAVNSLNIALASTGIYTKETSDEFQKFAEHLQATTGYSDDLIISNAAVLQSLGGLTKEGLHDATAAAVDMAAALNKDLPSVMEILGRAAEGNTTALHKLGITFREGASAGETFGNILDVIENKFGGAAAAKTNTFSGSLDLVKNSFEDLQKQIGEVIVQNPVIVEVFKTASKIFNDLTESVNQNKQGYKELVGDGIILVIDAFMGLSAVTDVVMRGFTSFFRAVMTGFNAMNAGIANILEAVGLESKEVADASTEVFLQSADAFKKTFSEDTGLSKTTEMLARLREGALKGFDALKQGATDAATPLKNNTELTYELTNAQIEANKQLKEWALSLANTSKSAETSLNEEIEALQLSKEQALVVGADFNNQNATAELAFLEGKKALQEQYYQDEQLRLALARDKGLIDDVQFHAAKLALLDKAHTAEKKSEVELTQFKNQQEKARLSATSDALSTISTLQNSKNKELFFIGKAAAIANATINMYEGISKAWAIGGPFGAPLAALVAVAGAAQIAGIVGTQPPAYEQGGIVGGNSFSGDNIAARVNSGEMILNRSQQSELFKLANGSGSQTGDFVSKSDLAAFADAITNRPAVIQIDGKAIFSVLRSGISSGRSFA